MVATAQELAGNNERVHFVVNDRPDLSLFGDASFDLVYSNIVLQHMPPELARAYLAEFFRVVREGGFVVFQIPSHLTDDWLPNGNDGTQLDDELHQADITIEDPPTCMACGEDVCVRVRVRNASAGEWQQDLTNQINLGNHWLDSTGAMAVPNDGRSRIPGRVQPLEGFVLELPIRAPSKSGTYVLEIDLVQEGVTWFATRGSAVARTVVEVVAPAGSTSEPHPSVEDSIAHVDIKEYPTFMMRGIERQQVERLIHDLGGAVLEAKAHVEHWVSYRYITRRMARI